MPASCQQLVENFFATADRGPVRLPAGARSGLDVPQEAGPGRSDMQGAPFPGIWWRGNRDGVLDAPGLLPTLRLRTVRSPAFPQEALARPPGMFRPVVQESRPMTGGRTTATAVPNAQGAPRVTRWWRDVFPPAWDHSVSGDCQSARPRVW